MDISFYLTPLHPCSYFPERQARTQFMGPNQVPDANLYQTLIDQGFRRTGRHLYRPACIGCADCQSLRLPVARFRPDRQQRRAMQKVEGRLKVVAHAFEYRQAHFSLYERYLSSRHGDGDMANPTPDDYLDFLHADWSKTLLIELSLDKRLMAVAVTDLLPCGLSAVYSFFEPELESCSPGVLCILAQLSLAQELGKDFLYLGYWIPGCRKMAYKNRYRPHQLYINGDWLELDA